MAHDERVGGDCCQSAHEPFDKSEATLGAPMTKKLEATGMTAEELMQVSDEINQLAGMTLVRWAVCDTCAEWKPMSPRAQVDRCGDCRTLVKRRRARRGKNQIGTR